MARWLNQFRPAGANVVKTLYFCGGGPSRSNRTRSVVLVVSPVSRDLLSSELDGSLALRGRINGRKSQNFKIFDVR